jgi:hypothetical protein
LNFQRLFIALAYGKNGVVQQAQPFAAMGADVVKSSAVLLSKFVLV